jgi:oxygen-independent coproporphyrinogen-3 oxidase
VANWPTKRRWVDEAFVELGKRGYHISSAQELVRNPERDHFVYRDQVWRGADLLATGVASFGHLQGVHYQNLDQLTDYLAALEAGRLPLNRALRITPHQALIREFVLQLKEGAVRVGPFRDKFGVDVREEFREALGRQGQAGYLAVDGDTIRLTRKGLLQVDTLLPEYFEPAHRAVRYT